MLKTIHTVLIAFTLSILSGSIFAANTYYVATNGNDSNPGTLAQPWASINKGVDLYLPGDTLYVRGGTYAPTSGIYFYRSGSAAASITFSAYNGEAVILDGKNMPANTTLLWIGCNYFSMQGFELRNATGSAIAINGGTFVTVSNCTAHDSQYSGITIGKNDMTTTHNITIQNCTVYNNCHMNDAHTLNGGWPGALVVGGANTVTVQNNTVYNNNGEGIIFYLCDNCHSISNVSHDNYGPNMYIDNATNCTVERNMLYSTGNTTYFRNGTQTAGIQFANEPYSYQNISSNISITNNILVNNNYAFYYGNYGKGGGLKNFTFANNSIYLSRQEALHVDADTHSNATFANNICTQSSTGTQAGLPASLTGLAFSHNLWSGKSAGAAASGSDINADPKFVNAGSTVPSDYKIQTGSPAIGAGMTLNGIAVDFFGATRSQPLDLGACAAPAGTTATPPATTPPTTTPPATTPPATTPPTTPPATPGNSAPVMTSAPSYSPNPAVSGEVLTFVAAAIDANNDTLTYTWNLGDGTTQIGATIVKTYAISGVFSVSVTVADGKGGSASQTISVSVNAPTTAATPLSVTTMGMNFNLSKANADMIYVIGTVPLPVGFKPNGTNAVITIGGYQHTATLNAKGLSSDKTFKISAHIARGVTTVNNVAFVMSVKRSALFNQLSSIGLSDANGIHAVAATINLSIGGLTFAANENAAYSVAGGK